MHPHPTVHFLAVLGETLPIVWYAKCHEMAIVRLAKSPYLCTIKFK